MSSFPESAALNSAPFDVNAIIAVADKLGGAGHHAVAYHLLENAQRIDKDPAVLNRVAIQMLHLASYVGSDEWLLAAEETLREGLALKPDCPSLTKALAHCALHLGRIPEAEELARKSLAAVSNQYDAQHTLAVCLLYQRRWAEAWDLYEAHAGMPPIRTIPKHAPLVPYWNGEPGHLLVIGEQGLGDEITFASIVEEAARHNEITLWCDRRLERLFSTSMPYATVIGNRHSGHAIVQPDYLCLVGSLATHYRRSHEAFPQRAFLQADATLRAEVRARLDALPGYKVGLAWTGGKPPSFWHRRQLPLTDLDALTSLPGISWVSLQYEPSTIPVGVHYWPDITEHSDYARTAALVAELDAVVCVPTAVAHLAGALGKRCFVLANETPRWFYGLDGFRSDWYDSLRILRQERIADQLIWPIYDAREALMNYLDGREP